MLCSIYAFISSSHIVRKGEARRSAKGLVPRVEHSERPAEFWVQAKCGGNAAWGKIRPPHPLLQGLFPISVGFRKHDRVQLGLEWGEVSVSSIRGDGWGAGAASGALAPGKPHRILSGLQTHGGGHKDNAMWGTGKVREGAGVDFGCGKCALGSSSCSLP